MSLVEERIRNILADKGIEFKEMEHEAVHSSEEAAKVTGLQTAKEGLKSMLFKTKEGSFVLVLSLGDRRVDTKVIARLENTGHITLANPDEVLEVAGVPVGCVPPFGHEARLKTYLSRRLFECEHLYFSAGSPTRTIRIRSGDLLKVIEEPVTFD